ILSWIIFYSIRAIMKFTIMLGNFFFKHNPNYLEILNGKIFYKQQLFPSEKLNGQIRIHEFDLIKFIFLFVLNAFEVYLESRFYNSKTYPFLILSSKNLYPFDVKEAIQHISVLSEENEIDEEIETSQYPAEYMFYAVPD